MNKSLKNYPVFYINLDKDVRRKKRMEFALKFGGWQFTRWRATDAGDSHEKLFSFERFWQKPSEFPGSFKYNEADPIRKTTKSELGCLCSWQRLIEHLQYTKLSHDWFLLMEDDVGSSLAVPDHWPFNLNDLIDQAGKDSLAIQMAPINGKIRRELYQLWLNSKKHKLLMPKSQVRSHGNGAILINRNALPLLSRRMGRWIESYLPNIHVLGHPRKVRPVADKWLYASLPIDKCWVTTFPLFVLEAETSSLHHDHVNSFHRASRQATLEIWKSNGYSQLLQADAQWRNII
ncbi:glycosyltransferase family 25 protein [Synechococcus sp. MU1650]|uniref:glycosyltransferase family 25 protein n=1 Tax=Synechococcus sp. MU1650 TaxID=2508352 RepID=UPI001CF84E86|nr:glycosyltransferase family 25 protein [Synechococcus sp. MU1650]MCB4378642.1 hypothetical protein [Synechococcus sp. MU1650]